VFKKKTFRRVALRFTMTRKPDHRSESQYQSSVIKTSVKSSVGKSSVKSSVDKSSVKSSVKSRADKKDYERIEMAIQ
jgi:hypothetical protein